MKTAAFLLAAAALPLMASAQLQIGPSTSTFVDISGTGTSVGTISDDSEHTITGAALTAAGFTGNGLIGNGNALRVGNNGAVIIGTSGADAFASATEVGYINSTNFSGMTASNATDLGNGGLGPRNMLAVLWDDNTPGSGGSLKWQVIGGDLIIQWTNEDHFNATGLTVTYEMIARGGVSLTSGQAIVEFLYLDTFYNPSQYQNDGGSATIGYKNWTGLAGANTVEFGQGGGNNTVSDPAFGDASMRPKVAGSLQSGNPALPHGVRIIPSPGALALVGMGGLMASRRRRR
jgi:hypothetical protein